MKSILYPLTSAVLATILLVSPLHAGVPTPTKPPSTATSPQPSPEGEGAIPLTAADFAGISTEEALLLAAPLARDLANLALRLDPTIDPSTIEPITDPVEYEVGDVIDFWVQNSATASYTQVPAELIYRTDVAYAWVEQGARHNAAKIQQAVDHFSDTIYPLERAAFGSEASPGVDGDPRIHILHTTGMGPGVAGYFMGGNEYSSAVLPFSNQKELFYMSLEYLNAVDYGTEYETVLAHEFQHMIHNNHDKTEQAWINEGLSEYAKEVAGYAPPLPFAMTFAFNDGAVQLNDWGSANADNTAHYGAAYLFVHYLAQRLGDSIAGELVAEQANGMEGVRRVLARGAYPRTVAEMFGDWVIANALNQPDAGDAAEARWGYPALPMLSIRPTVEVDEYPATVDEETWNYAADYIRIADDGSGASRTLTFAGASPTTSLTPVQPEEGNRWWWSNRTDNSETRLTRVFDLSNLEAGTAVEVAARMWWNIEPDYDYGYVMASADGIHWETLPGDYTTDTNPSGMNLGNAYTGSTPESESPDDVVWVTDHFDVSDYVGGNLWLRFDYVTDDAVTFPGWIVDGVSIPAIGYDEDFDGDAPSWESEGWVLSDGSLAQRWLVQVVELIDGEIVGVQQIPVDAEGMATWQVPALDDESEILLIVAGLTDGTTEPAEYVITVE